MAFFDQLAEGAGLSHCSDRPLEPLQIPGSQTGPLFDPAPIAATDHLGGHVVGVDPPHPGRVDNEQTTRPLQLAEVSSEHLGRIRWISSPVSVHGLLSLPEV